MCRNDNAPIFLADTLSFSIPEHTPASVLGSLVAQDLDEALNARVTYHLVEPCEPRGATRWVLVAASGAVSLESELDREEVDAIRCVVMAKDVGELDEPSLNSTALVCKNIFATSSNFHWIQYFLIFS